MPHFVNILVIVSGLSRAINFMQYYRNEIKSELATVSVIVYRLSNMVNFWFMIRLVRVQVQIMSQKERTKIILKKMRLSHVIEWIMLILLTIKTTCLIAHYLPKGIIRE